MKGNTINSPIETRHPADVLFGGRGLNKRQQRILETLPEFGSRAAVKKRDVSMLDLAALTAKTGDEFAMFTRKGDRLLMRGNNEIVPINNKEALKLRSDGYHWSGHTHPGFTKDSLIISSGDIAVLKAFNQKRSVIYNAAGKRVMIGE